MNELSYQQASGQCFVRLVSGASKGSMHGPCNAPELPPGKRGGTAELLGDFATCFGGMLWNVPQWLPRPLLGLAGAQQPSGGGADLCGRAR